MGSVEESPVGERGVEERGGKSKEVNCHENAEDQESGEEGVNFFYNFATFFLSLLEIIPK